MSALLLACTGCSRAFYRRQADTDAYGLVREKADHPHWRLDNYTIAIDPRSRMYDPFCLDCPPMPPDDPTSHQLMHCVDAKRGWPFWHDNGDTPYVENPAWPEYIEVDAQGIIKVSSDDAVRLALLHSRDYQSSLEELYLSALDVSFERFRFDSQFFAGYEIFGTFDGPVRSGRPRGSSILELSTFSSGRRDWAMQKLFPTGADLVVGFANSLVWQFAGPDNYNGNTLIDFALVQPLLRNAGRDRIMERLTVAERNLLANVRTMEQFRQGFSVDIITGSGGGAGPSRRGGVFGSGLEGFTGVGGGFGRLGGGGGGGGGGGAQGAGGFLGLLQAQREIQNQEDNVRRLRRNVARLTTLLEQQPSGETAAFLNQALQVAQARQALLSAESGLLDSRNGFEVRLDAFKVELGLPPQLCMQPSDGMLDRFQLIDPEIIRLPEEWEATLSKHLPVRQEIPQRIQANIEETMPAPGAAPVCALRPYPELVQDLEQLKPALADIQAFVENIASTQLPAIEQDLQKLRQELPRRRVWLEKLTARIRELRDAPCDLLPLGNVDPLFSAGDSSYPSYLVKQLTLRVSEHFVSQMPRQELPEELVIPLADLDRQAESAAIGNGAAARQTLAQLMSLLQNHELNNQLVVDLVLQQLTAALDPQLMAKDEITRNLIWRLDRSLGDAETLFAILSQNFPSHVESLTNRQAVLDELLQNPNQEPAVLFSKVVQGIFNPRYECGKTKVLTIDVVEDITRELTELQLAQAIARAEGIGLEDIDIRIDQALEVARKYRRDWMNARAALVDSWRLIQFNSDQLQSGLNIFFSGDIGNVGQNPFNLQGDNGRLRVGAQFDAPLTRLSERNTYRQSLIEYQQARRSYYLFEDNIALTLRGQLRTITTNQLNFELQRVAVIQAARQVMLNTFIDQEEQRTLTTRVTAARDAVQALGDLLNAQNSFMGFWVNYEVLRRTLDLNLGTLQLDSEGLWIDPGTIGENYGEFDPWLWRTEGCLPGELQSSETQPGEVLPGVPGTPAPPTAERDPVLELPPPLLLPPAPTDRIDGGGAPMER